MKELELGSNFLTTLPENMGNLSSLKKLDLEKNHMAEVPEIIGKLRNLKKLWLSNKNLTLLPKSKGSLSLNSFTISDNKLSNIPEYLLEMNMLDILVIADNPLERKAKKILKKLKKKGAEVITKLED